MELYAIGVGLHALGGGASLLSMLVPLVAHKGGSLHRRAGWFFTAAMALATLTGVAISACWILVPGLVKMLPADPRQAAVAIERLRAGGALFGVLSLMSAQAVVFGLVATRHRHASPLRHPLARGVTLVLGCASAAALWMGLANGNVLTLIFSGLGLLNALSPWRRSAAKSWLRVHIEAMLGACTVATTAFAVQVMGRLSVSPLVIALSWAAPVVLGMVVTALWTRRISER